MSRKRKKDAVISEEEREGLNIAYDTCIQLDIPVVIENNVLMTVCSSADEYKRFSTICRNINKNIDHTFSYGARFLEDF